MEKLAENLSQLKEDESRMARLLVSGSDLSSREVGALLRKGEAKSPEFAKEKGIIHEIKEPKIPKDASILHL